MNGNSQSFVILNGIRSNPNEAKENAIRNSLPVYDNPSELLELENSQKDISVRATAEVMNEMLKMKFSGIDIQKFMEIYTKRESNMLSLFGLYIFLFHIFYKLKLIFPTTFISIFLKFTFSLSLEKLIFT